MTDPAWPDVLRWIQAARNSVELLPPDRDRREEIRRVVGVSLESALGAVIEETGGILVDHGWLRILGSGSAAVPRFARPDRKWILVADDVVGGVFALHPPEGEVRYLAPDTLDWEPLGTKYSAWFRWCLTESLDGFYHAYRGGDWKARVRTLESQQGFSIQPPPWAKGDPYPERNWKPVPMTELYAMMLDLQQSLPREGDVHLRPEP
jgi:hypothetical protein